MGELPRKNRRTVDREKLAAIKKRWVDSKIYDADIHWLIERVERLLKIEDAGISNLLVEGLTIRDAWNGLLEQEFRRAQPMTFDISDDWAVTHKGRLVCERTRAPWLMAGDSFGAWRAENSQAEDE